MNNEKGVLAIVQARMGSSRFPGKVLKELWRGKSVLEFLVERLTLSKEIEQIVVATTDNPADDEILKHFKEKKIDCPVYRGSENDVLKRVAEFVMLIEGEGVDIEYVVEITADCPFVDPWMIDDMIQQARACDAEYLSNCIVRQLPDGFDVQVYKPNYLEAADDRLNFDSKFREHVGWNILRNGLVAVNYPIPEELFHPDWRLTLDYEDDYCVLKYIAREIDRIDFTTEDAINVVKENKFLLEINKNCKAKIPGVNYE